MMERKEEEGLRPLVAMYKIHKKFGEIYALKAVDFVLYPKEIVALIGDNGAGKTTLINILSGNLKPDRGEIYINGRRVQLRNSKDAINLGIETVSQDASLVDVVSIMRNIFMGREIVNRLGLLDKKMMMTECSKILSGDISVDIRSPHEPVANLSGGQRQAVAVARAMYFQASILILEEPVTALSVREIARLLENVKKLKEGGTSTIFTTHSLYTVHPIADRFVILRRGENLGDYRKEEVSLEDITKLVRGY